MRNKRTNVHLYKWTISANVRVSLRDIKRLRDETFRRYLSI
jgi:hypothetical protein